MNSRSGAILRAFTLIEVLVSLALIVLIGALVAPSLLNLSDRVSLDSAADQVAAAAAQAASEATRRAEPVELIAVPDAKGFTLIARGVASVQPSPTDPAAIPTPEAGLDTAPWRLRLTHLDAPARISRTDPRTALDVPAPPTLEDLGADALIAPAGPPETHLAVFMPDGSVSGAAPLFVARLDQVMRGTFSALTGRLTFARLPPLDPAARDTPPDATTETSTDTPSDPARAPEAATPPPPAPDRTAPPEPAPSPEEDPSRDPSAPRV